MRAYRKSGGGPPQSKTLARCLRATEWREAFWSAPALPPSRRAKAPLRRDGGWRFQSSKNQKETPLVKNFTICLPVLAFGCLLHGSVIAIEARHADEN